MATDNRTEQDWAAAARRTFAASDVYLSLGLAETEKKIQELLGGDAPFITELLEYAAGSGGKRFRPRLAMLAAATAGVAPEAAADVAAAVELIHLSTLLHDDVIDEAPLRRGRPSARRQFGNRISILGGDYLITRVFHHLVHKVRQWDVFEAVLGAANAMVAGEFFEIWWQNRLDLREEDYYRIITLKSARLLEASCRVGALVAGDDGAELAAFGDFGLNAGMSFQITDDGLDFSARAAELGKETFADVRAGKVTLPLIYGLGSARGAEVAAGVEAIWEGEAAEGLLGRLLNDVGALDKARDTARRYAEKSKDALCRVRPGEPRDLLAGLADWTWQRPF